MTLESSDHAYLEMYHWGEHCGLLNDGIVDCPRYAGTPSFDRYSDLGVGLLFACGIAATNGTLDCWELCPEEGCSGVNAALLSPPAGTFVDLDVVSQHACAVRAEGGVECWGFGTAELPYEDYFEHGQSIPKRGDFVRVDTGFVHSCGLERNGGIKCWGAGETVDEECMEDGFNCGQSIPPEETGFVAVGVGSLHSCALRPDETVVCWGSNEGGRTAVPPGLQ